MSFSAANDSRQRCAHNARCAAALRLPPCESRTSEGLGLGLGLGFSDLGGSCAEASARHATAAHAPTACARRGRGGGEEGGREGSARVCAAVSAGWSQQPHAASHDGRATRAARHNTHDANMTLMRDSGTVARRTQHGEAHEGEARHLGRPSSEKQLLARPRRGSGLPAPLRLCAHVKIDSGRNLQRNGPRARTLARAAADPGPVSQRRLPAPDPAPHAPARAARRARLREHLRTFGSTPACGLHAVAKRSVWDLRIDSTVLLILKQFNIWY